jgi:hypothetical protein
MVRRRKRSLASPESLEPRLALAGVVQFIDLDGDLVRVASSLGTSQQLAAAIRFALPPAGAAAGSRTIDAIDLSGPSFSGTSLSISARVPRGGRGDGSVNVGGITTGLGGVSAISVGGSFSSLTAQGNVNRVTVRGLSAGATILSDGRISEVAISGSIEGTAAAPVVIAAKGDTSGAALGRVRVGGRSSYGLILAGYDTTLSAVNGAARIESVVIGGRVLGTSIVAGVVNPNGLAFGDAKDRAIDRSDASRIGSVRLGSVVATQDSADAYGIVANTIGPVFVGGERVPPPADWQWQRVGTTDLIVSDIASTATPYTDFIADAIRAMETRTGSSTSEGILWNVTDGNTLPGMGTADPSWVIRTQDAWGQTDTHDSSDVQRQMLDRITSIIGGAKKVVDLSSLARADVANLFQNSLPDGGFLDAIIAGLKIANGHPEGERPVVRLLWGRADAVIDQRLEEFQAKLQDAAPNLTVIATLMGDYSLLPFKASWNHSKIVAADGQVAFVGGINMWSGDYLKNNPITDVGAVVEGPAAADAQKFLDVLWRFAYAHSQSGALIGPTKIVATPGIDPKDYLSIAPTPDPGTGDVRVMSVGRAAFIPDEFIATGYVSGTQIDNPVSAEDQAAANWFLTNTPLNGPTTFPGKNTWDGKNPSDTALRALVDSAKTSVVFCQQSMDYPQVPGSSYNQDKPSFDVRLFDSLARKVLAGIPVTLIVSSMDRKSGDYRANPLWTTEVMVDRLTKLTGSRQAAIAAASRSLLVTQFRYSDAASWPDKPGQGPGLHSKVIEVDGRAVYVGSQNAYPDEQQEFGFIIEDRAAVAEFNRLFIDPSVQYSTPALRPAPPAALSPQLFVPENPDTYGALLGTYRGAFDEVNLRPLYDSQGAEIQTMRRWLSASVSAGNVASNFAVVDTGRGFNAYFYAVDLSTGRTIVSKSAIWDPLSSSAELLDRPGPGAKAVFRGTDFQLSITRAQAASTYEVEAAGGGFQIRATLDAASAPDPVSAAVATTLAPTLPKQGAGGVLATVKAPLLTATGFIRGGGRTWSLNGGNGAIDFTQGLIPRDTEWEQASVMGTATDGTRVAVNLTTHLSPGNPGDNAVWAGSSLASVAAAKFQFNLRQWRVTTADGAVQLQFQPRGIHRERWNVAERPGEGFVQVAGLFSGTVRTGDGRVLTLRNVSGVIQTQDVRMLTYGSKRA